MSNMGYCRFRNTVTDLRDCYSAMSDSANPAQSEEEERARVLLIRLCRRIAEDFDDDGEIGA